MGGLILLAAFLALKLYRYIRCLENEINSLRLSAGEKMEYFKVRVGDIINGSNGTIKKTGGCSKAFRLWHPPVSIDSLYAARQQGFLSDIHFTYFFPPVTTIPW